MNTTIVIKLLCAACIYFYQEKKTPKPKLVIFLSVTFKRFLIVALLWLFLPWPLVLICHSLVSL